MRAIPPANRVRDTENPIKNGASAGPNVVTFRGSKPRPKARNKMVRDAIVSKAYLYD